MEVVIFGASGATGHELVRSALQHGYQVVAFVRDPSKLRIKNGRIKIVQGDVSDYEAVCKAVEPGSAVLSALGARTPLKRDPDLVRGIEHIVKVMERKRADRLIYLSFAGVKEGRQAFGFLFSRLLVPFLTSVVKDHEEKESVIRRSRLRWTIVRPAILTHGPRTGTFRHGENIKASLFKVPVSRADVADFMVQQVSNEKLAGKATLLAH